MNETTIKHTTMSYDDDDKACNIFTEDNKNIPTRVSSYDHLCMSPGC